MKIQVNNLIKSYAGDVILNDLSLEIVKGSKSAIVGENGSGKTTLLKVLSGEEHYQGGSVIIPKDMNVGYMMQVFPNVKESSKEFILSAFKEYCYYNKKLKELELQMMDTDSYDDVFEIYTKTFEKFEQVGGYELENTLESYAKGLNAYDVLDQPFLF